MNLFYYPPLIPSNELPSLSGADLGFSRGGDLQKQFENFFVFFLRSTKLVFRALSKHYRLCFGQNFCAADKVLKKQAKIGVFRHFLENFAEKNRVFSARAPP